jgi:aryl-alcohol dehydrogenase-like predicted oxidoreductase
MAMKYRYHKNERISVIGVGGYALSGAYGKKNPQKIMKIIQRAYDLGVTYFDVANIYGSAEEVLGKAVAPFRHNVWIATKVGWSEQGKPDCSPESVAVSCEQSLERLQTDYIDLYQIHFDDPETSIEQTISALEKLVEEGKIRHYGVGHLSSKKVKAYFSLSKPFSVLTELSAVARSAREYLLPLCQTNQIAVLAFSPTGRGLLTGKIHKGQKFEEGDIRRIDPLFHYERFASALRVSDKLATLAKKYEKTPVQLAITWVLAQPCVVSTLTGPSTITHLEENLEASELVIASEDLDELDTFFHNEDIRLQQEQLETMKFILLKSLMPEYAFTDLLYLLEVLSETKRMTENEIMPYYQILMGIHKQRETVALSKMCEVQTELRKRFL